jgi:hypothetical protein
MISPVLSGDSSAGVVSTLAARAVEGGGLGLAGQRHAHLQPKWAADVRSATELLALAAGAGVHDARRYPRLRRCQRLGRRRTRRTTSRGSSRPRKAGRGTHSAVAAGGKPSGGAATVVHVAAACGELVLEQDA